jgi:beta-lactamase class A
MQRRTFLSTTAAFAAIPLAAHAARPTTAAQQIAQIERSTGGRLGVFAIDTGTTKQIAYRQNERFPMCSTFKFLLVADVLARVDRGQEELKRRIWYGKSDLLDYAPETKLHVRDGMTVRDLCEAAIELSDNTAANLLLKTVGGPHAVTAYARSLDDGLTRLDRTEPSLNTAAPGDPRDTTTPAAMAADMARVLVGDGALSTGSRGALQSWLSECKTGTALLRAGLPSSWQVGDKTGTGGPNNRFGDSNTRNDIAITWPPGESPVIVTAYLTGATVKAADRDAAIASVGRIVGEALR